MPFPVVKLFYMAAKQISKPIAKSIKNRAAHSPFLRNYILLPPAQFYHSIESKIRMNILGIGRLGKARKMNEASAIELASDMLGETIVFSVAAATLYMEYRRQVAKEIVKEGKLYGRIKKLEDDIDLLKGEINKVKSSEKDSLVSKKEFNSLKASVAVLDIKEQQTDQQKQVLETGKKNQ